MSNAKELRQQAAELRRMADRLDRIANGTATELDAWGSATLFFKKTITGPTPRIVTRPDAPRVMRDNDVTRPADIHPASVRRAILPVDEKGNRFHAADVKYLRRFARLPIPTRRMWTGRHEFYTQAARTFARYNLIAKKGRAHIWTAGYTLADRLAFADQFDPRTLDPNRPSRTTARATPPTQNQPHR